MCERARLRALFGMWETILGGDCVKAEFDNALIKVWFTTKGVSRNFENVTKIVMSESSYLIQTANGNQYILSLPNVNMIEEIEG